LTIEVTFKKISLLISAMIKVLSTYIWC